MGIGSNDWNKGWFSSGPQSSPEAQAGQAARQQHDQAREAARRQAAQQNVWRTPVPTVNTGTITPSTSAPVGPDNPATFRGTVQGFAVTGLVAAVIYAYFVRHLAFGGAMVTLAVAGTVLGAVGGIIIYAVIVVLRVVFAILAVILKFAFYAALALGAVYFLGRFFG